jgi:hypothetical protein
LSCLLEVFILLQETHRNNFIIIIIIIAFVDVAVVVAVFVLVVVVVVVVVVDVVYSMIWHALVVIVLTCEVLHELERRCQCYHVLPGHPPGQCGMLRNT